MSSEDRLMLHPFCHILLVLSLSIVAVLSARIVPLAFLLLFALIYLWLCGRVYLQVFGQRLKRVWVLVLMVFVLQVLFGNRGEEWISIWFITISMQAICAALAFVLRFLIIIGVSVPLMRLSWSDYQCAFAIFRMPQELAFMVHFTMRMISILSDRFRKISLTLKQRGLSKDRIGLRDGLWLYLQVSLRVLAEVMSRSSGQAITLDLRGFRSSGKPTLLYQRRLGIIDMLCILVIAATTWLFWWVF